MILRPRSLSPIETPNPELEAPGSALVAGSPFVATTTSSAAARTASAFLTPRPQLGAPERDEYLALLGALGGLVGLAGASAVDAVG